MKEESHISSIVVYIKPENIAELIEAITSLEHVEVAAVSEKEGKLVGVIDTPTSQMAEHYIQTIKQHEGVLSTALVYHHVESNCSLDSLIEPSSSENSV